MKKIFDTKSATDKFFTSTEEPTEPTQNTEPAPNTDNTQKKTHKKRSYRYNLLIDDDLNEYLHFASWWGKKSMTQFVNDLIRQSYNDYIKDCTEKGKMTFENWRD